MISIIGVDCATEARRTGLAYAEFRGSAVSTSEAMLGGPDLVPVLADWLSRSPRSLLALDAPLGWPDSLRFHLSNHKAGEFIPAEASEFFARYTDRVIWDCFGRRPLEIGANFIARTAHKTLAILHALRETVAMPVPLAWSADFPDAVAAIEVYPAATLQAHGLPAGGYKKRAEVEVRRMIIDGLAERMDIAANVDSLEDNADVLDAAICVLAGADFLRGSAMQPQDFERARREGWIWVRAPNAARNGTSAC